MGFHRSQSDSSKLRIASKNVPKSQATMANAMIAPLDNWLISVNEMLRKLTYRIRMKAVPESSSATRGATFGANGIWSYFLRPREGYEEATDNYRRVPRCVLD